MARARLTPEQVADARAEAQRRIERRDQHDQHLKRLAIIEEQITTLEGLLDPGRLPLASDALGAALRAELGRLRDLHTDTRIAVFSTGTRSWGMDESHVRARDGEGTVETTWRVLLDRGEGSKRIASATEADDRKMRRWRAELRNELTEWLAELRATPFPWERTHELIDDAVAALARLEYD